ncbi:protocatechuate 3,4-dioxygenase subunit alpha [Paraburkholderia bonniea]|uniref:protocatechuate 3,4-dioxygenase subunit alpha n=1 Tax=Paraburkholderia bonniea TaxID=2152891 RepID=UPI001291EDD0|nr:protocatechuate 3,4-dioxygenase subunit alpha [Paraburkholderia bonniea]WJF89358.1 protocatechuate 3,4-dioxygenase subunit alpha [Paraburkholderia bonniea]WJF92673.1 protocatechuate 3,4-dioxygenase subunit alpha [Paraburkholderia bonniea]
MTELKQTPSQTVGPYFAYGLCPEQYGYDFKSLLTPELTSPGTPGEPITIIGQIFDGNGHTIGDALLEVAQTDSQGGYPASREAAAATGFRGFARVGTGTDAEHRFIVKTIKPGLTAERAANGEAPHLKLIVTMRGLLLHVFTRIYFSDETSANDSDPVLGSVPENRRATLIAQKDTQPNQTVYRFDIHMQGARETVFFDL